MAFFLRKVGRTRLVKEEHSESTLSYDTKEKAAIDGVWGCNGRVFIATNEGKQLVVTDCVPRPRWTEHYCTITDSGGCPSPVVAVLPNPSNPNQIYTVHSNSITDCFENNPQNNQWTKRHTFQLSNAKGALLLSVVIHPDTSMFFWCEKRAPTLGVSSCCLCTREVPENWDTDVPSILGAIVVILHSCPLVSLFIINKGICLVPHLPDEDNRLVFYWTFVPRALKAQIWNHNTVLHLDKTDFKSIIMELLPIWHSFPSLETTYILSLTTHPTTLELLLLDNTYSLSSIVIQEGKPLIDKLCILSIQETGKTKQVVRELFALGLFVGLVWESGLCDIFDSKSGMPLCTLTDLTGTKLNVWTCPGTVPGIGVWSSEGVWDLKSSSVLEVAEVIQTSVKPIGQNASLDFHNENCIDVSEDMAELDKQEDKDNTTTACSDCQCAREFSRQILPNCRCLHHNITMSGPVSAMAFLHEWGLFPHEAKVALSSVISKMLLDSSDSFIEKELLEKVVSVSFQSPVFALTLLFNHPLYKDTVIKEVENFLEQFQCDKNSEQKCVKTVLNDSLFPYMHKFVTLVKKFDEVLRDPETSLPMSRSNASSVAAEAQEIFNKLNLGKPESEAVFRLYFLHGHYPKVVVEALDQCLGLQSLESRNTSNVLWSQQWRKLYRLEWKDGQWQKSRAALEDPNNPFLSLLCNMLYSNEPDWLLNVKENGMAVVNFKDSDERAQEHVNNSFLDCLPALKVEANKNSTHVHSKLLWAAGQEMQAIQILLRHKMWSQALDFYESLPKDTNYFVLLFTMMIKAFLSCGAPKEVSLKALALVPTGFCSYEILSIMHENGQKCAEPFNLTDQILTIGDVRSHLQKFLR